MNKRIDIKTGYLCNNNCRFCVQAHNKRYGNRTTKEIKESLEHAIKDKCSGVVFTGGEVTIRKDVLEIVSYAKKLGFDIIQIQTNGRMLASMDFCKRIVEAGATEFSPALHGHNADCHDFLTRAKGSFKETVKGIMNLRKLNQKIITNTVITKPNYKYLPELAKLLVKLDVYQYQLAFIHAVGNAGLYFESMVPPVYLAKPYIKKALDVGIRANKNVMVEGLTFCTMNGYERYLSENYIPETMIKEKDHLITDYTKQRINEGKKKFKKCKECLYYSRCEGPWREYPEKFGSDEFIPIKNNSKK